MMYNELIEVNDEPPLGKDSLDTSARGFLTARSVARRFKRVGRLLANGDGFRPFGSPLPGRFAPIFENLQGKVR